MTPSEVRMIAFFFDVNIKRKGDDDEDWSFIFELDCKEITYQLTEEEHARLFAIYDEYSPRKEDYAHITQLVQTLKDIEYMQIKFQLFDGDEAFDSTVIIP